MKWVLGTQNLSHDALRRDGLFFPRHAQRQFLFKLTIIIRLLIANNPPSRGTDATVVRKRESPRPSNGQTHLRHPSRTSCRTQWLPRFTSLSALRKHENYAHIIRSANETKPEKSAMPVGAIVSAVGAKKGMDKLGEPLLLETLFLISSSSVCLSPCAARLLPTCLAKDTCLGHILQSTVTHMVLHAPSMFP
jgi:hypothetical protein